MADAPPPPVAIRITRPYDSEEEYLAQELEMISKTSITLVGAQPRPQGVVLRFELVLAGGAVLVRGEGRVVGFKPNAHRGVGGLTLRFTRIDARSKALLDKATAMREQRRPSSKPPKTADAEAAQEGPAGPPPLAAAVPAPVVAVPAPAEPEPAAGPLIPQPAPSAPEMALAPASAPAQAQAQASTNGHASPLPKLERDSLLDRLRHRANGLDPEVVRGILEKRRTTP